ncbi:MAG: ABC transporter permease subunit [Treponema sp.]|jgi:putative aldouronate transport system permease protein|nr:ABC transporter permease subunit [Treponema sp.]
MTKKKNWFEILKQREYRLFFMALPFMVLVFLLSYLPLRGWLYAFFNYTPGLPLTKESFVGLGNFRMILEDEYAVADIVRVMRNTFAMSFIGLASSALPLVFAVFLNEIRFISYRKTVQTLTTIPNFISWVLVYSVAYAMMSVNDGFINRFLMALGVIDSGVNFLARGDHVWIGMWAWGTWKGLGWGSIVYVAALTSIDQELYEAARVDGAGRFRCMWHITLPGLLPTYFVLLILSIANFINNGVDQYYIFQNPMNRAAIEVLDLYVYNQGIVGINYSYSIAISILKSLVSLILLFAASAGSKFIREESIF